MSMCGGVSAFRAIETEEQQLWDSVKAQITEQANGVELTPESVATQVVNGINYRFKAGDYTVTIWKHSNGDVKVTDVVKA